MKNALGLSLLVAVVLSAAGCTEPDYDSPFEKQDAGPIPVTQDDGGVQPVTDGGEEPVQTERFEIRLLGVKAEAYSSVVLDIAGVSASAGGVPLAVTLEDTRVELTVSDHAYLIATVDVPVGTGFVDLAITYDDAGAFETSAGAGAIEARRVVTRWRADVSAMKLRGRTVIHLDVADSLVPSPRAHRQLAPVLGVRY